MCELITTTNWLGNSPIVIFMNVEALDKKENFRLFYCARRLVWLTVTESLEEKPQRFTHFLRHFFQYHATVRYLRQNYKEIIIINKINNISRLNL